MFYTIVYIVTEDYVCYKSIPKLLLECARVPLHDSLKSFLFHVLGPPSPFGIPADKGLADSQHDLLILKYPSESAKTDAAVSRIEPDRYPDTWPSKLGDIFGHFRISATE